jgi:rhodanese-related sulfurtransferase
MKKILSLLFVLSLVLQAGFKSIDAETLVTMQKEGVPVIDIRTPQEWKERGIIPGAHRIMFFDAQGRPHAEAWLQKLSKIVKKKQDPFILYCAHANRTKAVGKWLSETQGHSKVYELEGGIEYGWREKGRKTVQPTP